MALNQKIIGIAKVCHEANKAYCEGLGDFTQRPWEQAPTWQQDSVIDGVMFYLQAPRQVHELHENRMKLKEADGWKLGPIKDAEKKEHPCMVPFGELPIQQQLKDGLFLSIVVSLSPMLAGERLNVEDH